MASPREFEVDIMASSRLGVPRLYALCRDTAGNAGRAVVPYAVACGSRAMRAMMLAIRRTYQDYAPERAGAQRRRRGNAD